MKFSTSIAAQRLALVNKLDESQAISFLDEAIESELAKPFMERNEFRAMRLKWVRNLILEKAGSMY